MTTPGPDWVEQARRFAAGLATDHPGLTDALGGLLGASSTERPAGHGERGDLAFLLGERLLLDAVPVDGDAMPAEDRPR